MVNWASAYAMGYVCLCFAFSALTLLVGRQEEHPACKNWVVRYWHGCLSGVRCKWFACGSADATAITPPPSNRHHRSNGDCLEGKRENYQVCSVQYCVQQLCTAQCAHIWTDLTVLWIQFCLTGPILLCLDLFFCMYYVYHCILHACVGL